MFQIRPPVYQSYILYIFFIQDTLLFYISFSSVRILFHVHLSSLLASIILLFCKMAGCLCFLFLITILSNILPICSFQLTYLYLSWGFPLYEIKPLPLWNFQFSFISSILVFLIFLLISYIIGLLYSNISGMLPSFHQYGFCSLRFYFFYSLPTASLAARYI